MTELYYEDIEKIIVGQFFQTIRLYNNKTADEMRNAECLSISYDELRLIESGAIYPSEKVAGLLVDYVLKNIKNYKSVGYNTKFAGFKEFLTNNRTLRGMNNANLNYLNFFNYHVTSALIYERSNTDDTASK